MERTARNRGEPQVRIWRLAGERRLELGASPRIMGILNVTPDSFSDGGKWFDRDRAIAHGREMAAQGAHIIDVGGESTRPGSGRTTVDDELDRTVPVIEALAGAIDCPLSIDTTRAAVARAAVDAGASIINDISGFTFDRDMAPLAVESGAGLVVMHIRGTPDTMQDAPSYGDTFAEVRGELEQRIAPLLDLGVDPACVMVDPGIGFGKRQEDNLRLLARLEELGRDYPVLVGCSRKSFLGAIGGREVDDRLPETIATTIWAALAHCSVVRVHDVDQNRRALAVFDAIRQSAADGPKPPLR